MVIADGPGTCRRRRRLCAARAAAARPRARLHRRRPVHPDGDAARVLAAPYHRNVKGNARHARRLPQAAGRGRARGSPRSASTTSPSARARPSATITPRPRPEGLAAALGAGRGARRSRAHSARRDRSRGLPAQALIIRATMGRRGVQLPRGGGLCASRMPHDDTKATAASLSTWRVILPGVALAAIATRRRDPRRTRARVNPKPLPPLANPDDPKTPAKELFGRRPTAGAARGARRSASTPKAASPARVALPINGQTWQVMRLSRNRNWGHPTLVEFLEQLGREGHQGRLARAAGRRHVAAARRPDADRPCQPSGRPRRRHLADADARPRADAARARGNVGHHGGRPRTARTSIRRSGRRRMPRSSRRRPRTRRSSASSSMRRSRRRSAARPAPIAPGCARCGRYWGHDYHFHIRMRCPADSPDCKPQEPVPAGDGCGKELDWWFTDAVLHPKPPPPPKRRRRRGRRSRWPICRPPAGRCCWRPDPELGSSTIDGCIEFPSGTP